MIAIERILLSLIKKSHYSINNVQNVDEFSLFNSMAPDTEIFLHNFLVEKNKKIELGFSLEATLTGPKISYDGFEKSLLS